jgi:hypothetical protein
MNGMPPRNLSPDPRGFVHLFLAANYPARDYHRIYFGEIVALAGTSAYH